MHSTTIYSSYSALCFCYQSRPGGTTAQGHRLKEHWMQSGNQPSSSSPVITLLCSLGEINSLLWASVFSLWIMAHMISMVPSNFHASLCSSPFLVSNSSGKLGTHRLFPLEPHWEVKVLLVSVSCLLSLRGPNVLQNMGVLKDSSKINDQEKEGGLQGAVAE